MTTVITDDRKAALVVGYIATDWTQKTSYADYKALIYGWTVRSLVRDGVCIGAVYSKDGEVHVSVVKEMRGKWATRGLLKQIFTAENYKTRVTKGHEFMHGILKRMGMVADANGYFQRVA